MLHSAISLDINSGTTRYQESLKFEIDDVSDLDWQPNPVSKVVARGVKRHKRKTPHKSQVRPRELVR